MIPPLAPTSLSLGSERKNRCLDHHLESLLLLLNISIIVCCYAWQMAPFLSLVGGSAEELCVKLDEGWKWDQVEEDDPPPAIPQA